MASERQHDLADMVCVLDAPMGGGGCGERKGRVDQRSAAAFGEHNGWNPSVLIVVLPIRI